MEVLGLDPVSGAALAVERPHDPRVDRVRFLRGVADAGDPDLAELGQRPDHVEDRASLAAEIEAEAVQRDDLKEVLGQEAAIGRRAQIVGGVVVLRRPVQPRQEETALLVEIATGEELQGHEGRRRPPSAG